MTSPPEDKWKFSFIPEFADCIARVASVWARLEYDVNASIWTLAEIPPAAGACITSQIYTLQGRLMALISLANLRRVDPALIGRINKFSDRIREGQQIRNRILHDQWLQDTLHPDRMGHLRITADRKLEYIIKSVDLPSLRADLEKLEDFQREFLAIREAMDDALPSLPYMSDKELHPIVENRPALRNPTTD